MLNSLFGEIPQKYVDKINNATIETIDNIFVNLGCNGFTRYSVKSIITHL
ncbi:hypothetical protein LGL55_15010 [Clostridium tagluense]|nr:hypothetical protein [Clostridium tagluense]MCB2365526.1 hypothetical protein [Clostridium tagluense]